MRSSMVLVAIMDKRGITEFGDALLNCIQLAIVIVAIFMLSSNYSRIISDTRQAEPWSYTQDFIYGSGGFHVIDSLTGRSDPFSVDINRFDDQTLDAFMSSPDNRMAGAWLIVTDKVTHQSKSAYWNKRWYEIYAPLPEQKGSGSVQSYGTQVPVLVYGNGFVHPGELHISVVMPS